MISNEIYQIMDSHGIIIKNESPLEIREKETDDVATGWFAEYFIGRIVEASKD